MTNKDKRSTVQIPEGTAIHKFLFEDNKDEKYAKWQVLDKLIEQIPKDKEDWAVMVFRDFVVRMSILYPEKKEKFEKLEQLVIWGFIRGEELTEAYFKKLKELCK